jgi:dienelactone hydrolase
MTTLLPLAAALLLLAAPLAPAAWAQAPNSTQEVEDPGMDDTGKSKGAGNGQSQVQSEEPGQGQGNAQDKGAGSGGQPKFTIVQFPSGDLKISGALFKPKGPGPFPAIIYNHGSEPSSAIGSGYGFVMRFYQKHGFVVFMPCRRGHTLRAQGQPVCSSEGEIFKAVGQNADAHTKNLQWLKEQETDNLDVEAGVAWLKQQPFVNKDLMLMTGLSFGGIQTVLASEKGLGMKAFIPFAPGAMSWKGVPELHEREKQALQNAKAPVFILQAQNDYNLGPSEYLGKVLDKKGGLNRHKVYPPFDPDNGPKAGHGGFATKGADIWGDDVFAFMKDVLGPKLTIVGGPSDKN